MGTSDPVMLRARTRDRDHAAARAALDDALHAAHVDLADTRATIRDLTTISREPSE